MNHVETANVKTKIRRIRLEPFSKRDQAKITHQLHESPSQPWTGSRKGIKVQLQVYEDLFGKRILFQVCLKHRWTKDEAPTVAEALEKLNRVIRTREWEQKSHASQN